VAQYFKKHQFIELSCLYSVELEPLFSCSHLDMLCSNLIVFIYYRRYVMGDLCPQNKLSLLLEVVPSQVGLIIGTATMRLRLNSVDKYQNTEARCSVFGWGTMLQAARSRVRVQMRWIFFNVPTPSPTMVPGLTQPLTEMSTRNLPGGKRRQARKTDSLTAICELIV
jgi:hypothetical protein